MVQRYVYDNVLGMNSEIPDYGPKGDWVKYEDYAALEEKLKSLAHAIVNAGFDPVGYPDFELAESIVNDN